MDTFWRAGVDAGYESDGEPGPRPIYGDDYYGGFLLDPDGNSIEAVHFEGSLTGAVDHLWIRVADVQASKRFYETIAPHARIALGTDTPERAGFNGPAGSFSVLSGDHVTENLHMAFPASENQAVEDFHRDRAGGRLPRQRQAGRAAGVPRRLLRRLRPRSRRQQHRAGEPQPLSDDCACVE